MDDASMAVENNRIGRFDPLTLMTLRALWSLPGGQRIVLPLLVACEKESVRWHLHARS